jgi:hypothetical protein
MAEGIQATGRNDNYVELGVQRGHCFNTVAPYFKNAYAVDINDSYPHISGNANLKWFQGQTQDFIAQHQDVTFDMVFIDADHSFEASRADFDGIFELVRDNGLIMLHDTYPPSDVFTEKSYCYDTYRTAEFIKDNYGHKCEIVTIPFYMGVSIVRKLDRQLEWMK